MTPAQLRASVLRDRVEAARWSLRCARRCLVGSIGRIEGRKIASRDLARLRETRKAVTG